MLSQRWHDCSTFGSTSASHFGLGFSSTCRLWEHSHYPRSQLRLGDLSTAAGTCGVHGTHHLYERRLSPNACSPPCQNTPVGTRGPALRTTVCLEAPQPPSESHPRPAELLCLPFEGPAPLPARVPLVGRASWPPPSAALPLRKSLAIRAPSVLAQDLFGQKTIGPSTKPLSFSWESTALGSRRHMPA